MECEICGKDTYFIKDHHIHSKSFGGSNEKHNIAYICSDCHDKVHYGIIIIEGKFQTINGIKLIWRYFTENSIIGMTDPQCWIKPNADKIQEQYLRRNKC